MPRKPKMEIPVTVGGDSGERIPTPEDYATFPYYTTGELSIPVDPFAVDPDTLEERKREWERKKSLVGKVKR